MSSYLFKKSLKPLGLFFSLAIIFLSKPAFAELRLDQSDVILIVLRQNLGVLSASYDPKIAATLITEVKSRFDTLLAGQVRYNLDQSDKQSIVFGTDNRQVLYEANASKVFPFGMESRAYLTNQRETTNTPFATDPAFFETRLGFELRAPMLRNRFGKSDRGEVKLAEAQEKTTTQDALNQLDEQVYQAVSTYWRLVASYYYLDVGEQFLKKAEDFLKITQAKRFIGLSEDPDVLAAEALVEQRKVEILRAKNFIEDSEDRLRTQLNLKLTDRIKPKEKLSTKFKIPSKATIFEAALRNRNDYLALLKEADAKDIRITVAKDQKLPRMDLFTSLELNSVDPSYNTVLEQTFSGQNPNWFIGLDFNLAFENRLAKSVLTRAQLEKARLLVNIKDLENNIAFTIFEALREYQLQRKETIKFAKISNLQKKRLEIEEGNYLQGRSSSDIIVRFQTDWLEAEKQRLESELREKQASVDLRRIAGTLVPENLKKFPNEQSTKESSP